LAVTEVVTGETILVDDAADPFQAMRVFFDVAEERGHEGVSVVVDERGQPITHPWYLDRMGAPNLHAGTWAFCREPRAEALGLPSGTDFARLHAPELMFHGGSPYLPEPHFYHQLYVQEFGNPNQRQHIPVCSAGPVAWRPDGRKICVIDIRLGSVSATPNATKFVIWEYDLALEKRRRIVGFPSTWPLDMAELTYSSDGEWLHLCDPVGGANLLVRLADGLVVGLPFLSTGAGWNPRNGPSAMIVTTVEPRTGRLVISDYDVSTGAMERRSDVESPNGLPLRVRELSMSVDGCRALVTAPLGIPGVEQQRRGGVKVAVVIDIKDGEVMPVLPVRFRTPGAQRRHTSPRWCERQIIASSPTVVADRLLDTAVSPASAPDGEEMRHDHLDRWLEVAAGIEQAWSSGRIQAPQFADELVQHALNCYEIDDAAGSSVTSRLRAAANRHPVIRATVRWIDHDRPRPDFRSNRVNQLATLTEAAAVPPDADASAGTLGVARRSAGRLLDRMVAADTIGELYVAAYGLVHDLCVQQPSSDVCWKRLATLTGDALRQRDYSFAAKAGLVTVLWNGCLPNAREQLRGSGLDRAPEDAETAILVDCVEACGHLDGHDVVGEDSETFFDVTDVRLRTQSRLRELDVAGYLTHTGRVATRRPSSPVLAPDPGATREEGEATLLRKRLFVSYVQEDKVVVDRLVAELTKEGYDVWMDRTHLLAGQTWKSEITKAIRAGDFFLACFSAASTTKRASYANEELIIAAEQLRLMPRGRQWFIPVRLDPCTIPDLPIGPGETLDKDVQYVDLSADWTTGVRQLVRALGPALVT
jgi:hypothetical protein